jgi:hypothetical protein
LSSTGLGEEEQWIKGRPMAAARISTAGGLISVMFSRREHMEIVYTQRSTCSGPQIEPYQFFCTAARSFRNLTGWTRDKQPLKERTRCADFYAVATRHPYS